MYDGDCNIRIEAPRTGTWSPSLTPPSSRQNRDERKTARATAAPVRGRILRSSTPSRQGSGRDFIVENIDKALPVDEFKSTFDKAVKEATK
jgi:hypothetical protein